MTTEPNTKTEVAIVTGAASGIGAAVGLRLAARGAAVGLVDVNEKGLEATASSIRELGGRCLVAPADVSDDDAIARVVSVIAAELGDLSTAVACAGIAIVGDVTTQDLQDWDRTIAVNLTGVFLLARHTVPGLIERGGGTFTAIASDGGLMGAQSFAAYCASKHAVVGLIRSMALDHGPKGVRSNAVCPGFVDTPMAAAAFESDDVDRDFFESVVPMGRFANAEEVADAVAHLSSNEASYVNGLMYSIDGGSTAGYYNP